jgi:aerobic-type carbon monoxide dehydrogenase small subunit (CoxS/CutS family)
MSHTRIEFVVNGNLVVFQGDGELPLLEFVRNHLDLKGARFGCGQGLCGACTLIQDGRAIFSCSTPMWAVGGASIETIEGLSFEGALHPLQQAFLDHQAGQCGYCLTGIIMRAKALLGAQPHATRRDIADDLERNLCRCGAHQRILDSIEDARDRLVPASAA